MAQKRQALSLPSKVCQPQLKQNIIIVKDMLNNGSEHGWVELADFWAFYGLSV
jgi:hypothetical protein